MAINEPRIYNISSAPRGYGVVIVNTFEKYEGLRREAAGKEIENLKNLVTSMGLILDMQRELTKANIILLLENISKRGEMHSMIFIAICSHGGEDGIYGVDYGEHKKAGGEKEYAITLEEVRIIFNSSNCPQLKDKPKIIIVNGCIEKSVRSRSRSFIGNESDFLTIYPSLSGQYRDFKHESVFIDILCDTLVIYQGYEIQELIPVIHGALMKKSSRIVKIGGHSVKLVENCVVENTLTKLLYLNMTKTIYVISHGGSASVQLCSVRERERT